MNDKCPLEYLQKHQFTIHLLFNAVSGDADYGWCGFVCKGNFKQINFGEKELFNYRVKVFWQKNYLVDSVFIRNLARRFVENKVAVHGEDVWLIIFCENISAHLYEEVKIIFGEIKVFHCFLPPNMTNFLQPIDAVLGMSV